MQFDLVRDPDHTEEIDPIAIGAENAIKARQEVMENLRRMREQETDDEKRAELDTEILEMDADLEVFRADMEMYEAGDHQQKITIRYLPPAKMEELQNIANRNRHGFDLELLLKPQDELTRDELDAVLHFREVTRDIERETVRWGVVGWDLVHDGKKVPFVEADALYKGRAYKVADWRVVDIVALADWLSIVSIAIWDLSRLGGERRKK